MQQPQPFGVQSLPRKGDSAALAVDRVADQRMTEGAEMDPDLVSAAGFQAAAQQRGVPEALGHRVARNRLPAARGDRHPRALDRVAAHGSIHGAIARDVAVDDGEVLAPDAARLQLAHEVGLCLQRLRHDEETAGVLVEAVHDARPRDASERRRVREQGVEQGAPPVAAAGMDDEPGGLVQHEQGFVLERHVQGDVFRLVGRHRRVGSGQHQDFTARGDFLPRHHRAAVERNAPVAHPLRQPIARVGGQQGGQRLVQAQAGAVGRHGQRDRLGAGVEWDIIFFVLQNRISAMAFLRHSVALLLGVLVAACGLLPDSEDETRGWSAQKLYSEAKDNLNQRNYATAITYYQKLEARYPYGRFAQQSQLEMAYAYYKDNESAQAVGAADRFIKLHPGHPNVDYAYYLRGLANFNEEIGWVGYLGGQDLTERDPKAARLAFEAFKDLVTRFPKSRYTPDAIARMNYLLNALASHEVHVARYYMKRSAYVAAANRAQYALKAYPQAPANEEGLVILVKAYDALGMSDLRDDAERVLNRNFPDSVYLKGGPKSKAPWWQIWNW